MNTNQTTKNHHWAWIAMLLCGCFLFYKYILQVSPSVMTHELMQHFNIDGLQLGNLAAMFFYAYLVMQLLSGPLLDRYSPRILMTTAIALCAFGAIGFAHAHTFHAAALSRATIGLGAAFATVGYMKMASVWFPPKQFAFWGGLLATAAMAGSMAGQAPLAILVNISGWHNSLYYCGLVGIVLALLFFLLTKSTPTINLPNKRHAMKTPKWRDFVRLLSQRHNWLLMLYSGLAFSPTAVFGGLWGNPFLEVAYHYNKQSAATLVSMTFFGLAVGGPLWSLVSNRLGSRFKVMLFGVVLSLISLTIVLYTPNLQTWMIATGLFLFGIGTGAFMLAFALGRELNDLMLAASVVGLINTGDAIFGAFSEPLVGKILDLFEKGNVPHAVHVFSVHDFHLALSLLPLYLILASFCLIGLKRYCKISEHLLKKS